MKKQLTLAMMLVLGMTAAAQNFHQRLNSVEAKYWKSSGEVWEPSWMHFGYNENGLMTHYDYTCYYHPDGSMAEELDLHGDRVYSYNTDYDLQDILLTPDYRGRKGAVG